MGFAIEGSWRGESSLAKSDGFEVDPGKLIWIGGIHDPGCQSQMKVFLGFPAKNGIFLVVTGDTPQDMELKMQIWKMVFLFPGWSCLEEF